MRFSKTKWYFWLGLGLGVVFGLLGVVLLASASDQPSRFLGFLCLGGGLFAAIIGLSFLKGALHVDPEGGLSANGSDFIPWKRVRAVKRRLEPIPFSGHMLLCPVFWFWRPKVAKLDITYSDGNGRTKNVTIAGISDSEKAARMIEKCLSARKANT